jgi:sugar phosphate isomerase/epimerase
MSKSMLRRDFLTVAGAAVVAIPATAPAAMAANAPHSTESNKEARLFPGCCAYSYLKYFKAGSLTMEGFIQKAVELGSHSVDITTYWLKSTEPEYLTSLRRLAFRNGMALSGIAIRSEMCQSDAAKRAEEVSNIQHWVDAAELLGAPHVRVFGGQKLPAGITEKQAIEQVAETWKTACDYSGKKGITLGIETHAAIPVRASTALEILRRVDSPYAGINLDVSNFEAKTDDEMYSDIEACIPYATHTHIRDVFGFTKRPIDLDRVWRLFAQAGYKGYMSAEYEAEEDPSTGVPKLMEKIKTLCRKYSST